MCVCAASLELVRSCDPQYAKSLNANDWFRLKRALEVHHQTGRYYSIDVLVSYTKFARPVSSFKSTDSSDTLPYEYNCLFLTMSRILLYQRIDTRCEQMIRDGLLQVCFYETTSSNDDSVSHVNRRPSH